MDNFGTPLMVVDGPVLAAVAAIIAAIGGLVTALGKVGLSFLKEYLALRDREAMNTIRTKNDELHAKDLKIRKLERQLAKAQRPKERTGIS
jgi:hypothetical protein